MSDERAVSILEGHDVKFIDVGSGRGVGVVNLNPANPSQIAAARDGGPYQTVTRTYTAAADGSTAFDITPAPAAGLKVVAMDIIVSVDTACEFSVQMETSGNVLASAFLPANPGFQQLTPRGYLKGDLAAKKLQAKTSVASKVAVTVISFTEA